MKVLLSKMRCLSLLKDTRVIKCLSVVYLEHRDRSISIPQNGKEFSQMLQPALGRVLVCPEEPPHFQEQERSQHSLKEMSLQSWVLPLVVLEGCTSDNAGCFVGF